MILKKFYLKCLSHGSYFLADEDSREAAVIDPQRDTGLYEDMIRTGGYRLKYVLETHLHADFVSGHSELASKTGAEIVFGEEAHAEMRHSPVVDGDILRLGRNVEIRVLATPGHTPESVCYLARDLAEPSRPMKLFSGDTVFVGDVGRPDLLGADMPARALASLMYDTLNGKILTLPDETEIYPAHGAGSACGRSLGDAEYTTLAEQKHSNYALQPMDRESFITLITEDQPEAPAYFKEDARINRQGPAVLDAVMAGLRPLKPREFAEAMDEGHAVLDTRGPEDFARGSIHGALDIGLDGQFAGWVGALIPKDASIILIAEEGREEEAALRCARVGFDRLAGYLEGGMDAWKAAGLPVAAYERAGAAELERALQEDADAVVLDVRRPAERQTEFLPGSLHIPLDHLRERARELPKGKSILIHCASGYRSAMAVGVLRQSGFTDVRDVAGGLRLYADQGYEVAIGAPEESEAVSGR
ncbi:MAG: Rhodanese-like protein [Fibrobacteres bacterium]|nr:Rhodanese-like protein [Fibrobacterota bacterium]